MKVTLDQELALGAALLHSPDNFLRWNSLIKSTPIMELDASITRAMPSIYQNLRAETSADGLQKLKGSYLFTWSKNTEFLTNIKPLLLLLEESDINYRVLKGGALNFLSQSLAIRSMGDIDFLVGKKDLPAFQIILEKAGFRKKFADACPHIRSGNSDPELNYVNSKNVEIDLHVMEDRRPKLLFYLMLETPALICEYMDIRVKIPPPELLIMHSIYHGNIGVQSSDEIQSLLDVRRLVDFIDPAKLLRFSSQLHFEPLLDGYLRLLFSITAEPHLLAVASGSNWWKQIRYSWDSGKDILARLRDYPSIRKSRNISLQNLRYVYQNFQGHRLSYCFWLYTSKLRQLERLIFLIQKGFLRASAQAPVTFSNCASQSQDWRFVCNLTPKTKRTVIEMRSESFASQSFLVFANGVVAGVTDRNKEGLHFLELLNPASRVEISLRLPMNGCEACAQKLKDLIITIS